MMGNSDYAKGLRQLADFLDSHPDLPTFNTPSVSLHLWTKDEFLAAVRSMGSAKKNYEGTYFSLDKKFSGGVTLTVQCYRGTICEKVVIGEEEIEITDPAAPKVKVKREKYEWRCDPLALLEQ